MVLYDYQGRWTVKEASTERLFQGVRDDLERLALGCYFAEVAELLAVEGVASSELLSLILNSLHALDKMKEKPLALVKAAFELKAMCLSGYEPLLDGCAVCAGPRRRSRASICERAWSTVLPAGERWGRASPCLSTSTHCGLWSISPMEIQSGSSPFR